MPRLPNSTRRGLSPREIRQFERNLSQLSQDVAVSSPAVEDVFQTMQALLDSATDYDEGAIVELKGYYSPGDGGQSYWVRDADPVTTPTASEDPITRGEASATDAQSQVWLLSTGTAVSLGADPAGVIDSTVSFNLYIAFEAAKVVDELEDYSPTVWRLPPGEYSVSTVDMTEIALSRNVQVEAYGCILVANTPNKSVLDCVGSRWLTIRGLTVYSDETVGARNGIQIGPLTTETNDENRFVSVQCLGQYSLCAFLNSGSSKGWYEACRFNNSNVSSFSYGAVFDGANQQTITSDYATVSRVSGAALELESNTFASCNFRQTGGGDAFWVSNASGFEFDKSCVFEGSGYAHVQVYSTVNHRSRDITLKGSFEGTSTDNTLVIIGDSTTTSLINLHLEVNFPDTQNCIIGTANVGDVDILNADVRVNTSAASIPAGLELLEMGLNATASGTVKMSGEVRVTGLIPSNLNVLDTFSGIIYLDDDTNFSPSAEGAYIAASSEDETFLYKMEAEVSTEVDADNYTSGGVFLGPFSGLTNFPTAVTSRPLIHVVSRGGAFDYIAQTVWDQATGVKYHRAGTFANIGTKVWREVWDTGNLVKQTDTFDTTSGSLLLNFAYGLGGLVADTEIETTDLDNVTRNGWHRYGSGAANTPPDSGGGNGGLFVMNGGSGSRLLQFAFYGLNTTNEPWIRTYNGASWTSWREMWTSGNLVKTTSATDTTDGSVVTIDGDQGWHGIGANISPTVTNWDSIDAGGFYKEDGAATGQPVNRAENAGIVIKRSNNRNHQLTITGNESNSLDVQGFIRTGRNDTSYTDWAQLTTDAVTTVWDYTNGELCTIDAICRVNTSSIDWVIDPNLKADPSSVDLSSSPTFDIIDEAGPTTFATSITPTSVQLNKRSTVLRFAVTGATLGKRYSIRSNGTTSFRVVP